MSSSAAISNCEHQNKRRRIHEDSSKVILPLAGRLRLNEAVTYLSSKFFLLPLVQVECDEIPQEQSSDNGEQNYEDPGKVHQQRFLSCYLLPSGF